MFIDAYLRRFLHAFIVAIRFTDIDCAIVVAWYLFRC